MGSLKINVNKNSILANSEVEYAWNSMMEIPTRSSYYFELEFGTLAFAVPTLL
jgi:hypothetical protein